MKWTYLISQKIKVAISLAVIIVMVLMTNFLNKRYFIQLQNSFSSVYEDRLMVEVYIYNIANNLHEKRKLWEEMDKDNISTATEIDKEIDESIHTLVLNYEKTVLTEQESILFSKLKVKLTELSEMEESLFLQVGEEIYPDMIARANELLDDISTNLDALSDIQQEEGQRLIEKSKQIIASSKTASKLELIILIGIGLVVQALIFSSKSVIPKFNQNSRLN